MKILSLYLNLPSTASLFIDDRVVAATHEERFTRNKNDEIFPESTIKYCLETGGLKAADLDGVAVASYMGAFDDLLVRRSRWTVDDYLREQHEKWKVELIEKSTVRRSLLDVFPEKIDLEMYPAEYWKETYTDPERSWKYQEDRERIVAEYLEIEASKVRRIEHHRCHAAYSYYASHFRNTKVLALTIDAFGDGLNATIGEFDESGKYTRHFETGDSNLARVYRYMTLLLGMKPNEHEYKLMGLAPYGKAKYAQRALDIFKSTLYVDGIEFKYHEKPTDSYFWFKDRLEGARFDQIAWALQTWVEDILVEWVRNAIQRFGVRKLVIAGGVAMNIKAMGKIAALDEVEDLFIGGSASDESMAVSAGICLAEDLTRENEKNWSASEVCSITRLYLGPEATFEQEEKAVAGLPLDRFEVIRDPDPVDIARQLKAGRVLARCAGRMEFGQRALGNRSILADPSDLRVKEKINTAIKSRDFWMPFAPVVLDTFVDRYLINPKRLQSPHMTIGFDTTPEGYDHMIAACHPADRTARAQILEESVNPELYRVLKEFEKLTGRGALLNTSFNLHGYPIVNTPSEAVDVLLRSGLDGLILNHFLILTV